MVEIRPKKGTVIKASHVDVSARKWGRFRKFHQTGTHNATGAWAKGDVTVVVREEYPSGGDARPKRRGRK